VLVVWQTGGETRLLLCDPGGQLFGPTDEPLARLETCWRCEVLIAASQVGKHPPSLEELYILVIQCKEKDGDHNHSDENVHRHDSLSNDSMPAKRAAGRFVTNAVAAVTTMFSLAHSA
jgi:hypothetical protein